MTNLGVKGGNVHLTTTPDGMRSDREQSLANVRYCGRMPLTFANIRIIRKEVSCP